MPRASATSGAAPGAPALLAPILAAIAEAAWLGVYAAATDRPIGGPGPAGVLLPCIVAALIGLAAVRLLPGGPARAPALLGVTILVVLVAVGVGRTWLAVGTAQPVGIYLVLGLAVLRGAAQGDPFGGPGPVETLVRRSPWLLAGGWALGFFLGGDGHEAFVAAAATCTLAFVVAAALALGMSRLAALPEGDRGQLGGNRAWLALVAVVVGVAALVSLPLAGVVGGPLGTLAAGLMGVVMTVVLGAAAVVFTGFVVILDLVAGLLRDVFHLSAVPPPPPPPPTTGTGPTSTLPEAGGPGDPIVGTIIGLGLVIGLGLLAWWLARRWQGARRAAAGPPGVPEQRSIAIEARAGLPALHLAARLRARSGPHGALGAYPRLLHDWAGVPALARDPMETPAEHAARLRAAGTGDLGLDLLAADYELARFGNVPLSAAEERRSVRRWHRLRRHRGRAPRRS